MPAGLTSPADLMLILVLALILLGPEKLIEVAGSAGKALAQVRRWTDDLSVQVRESLEVDQAAPAQAPTTDASEWPAPAEAASQFGGAITPAHVPLAIPAPAPSNDGVGVVPVPPPTERTDVDLR